MPYLIKDENGIVIGFCANQIDANQEFVQENSQIINDYIYGTPQEIASEEAKNFLNATDWKVLRHIDQTNLSIPTSLSEAEYMNLLADRQSARDKVK